MYKRFHWATNVYDSCMIRLWWNQIIFWSLIVSEWVYECLCECESACLWVCVSDYGCVWYVLLGPLAFLNNFKLPSVWTLWIEINRVAGEAFCLVTQNKRLIYFCIRPKPIESTHLLPNIRTLNFWWILQKSWLSSFAEIWIF